MVAASLFLCIITVIYSIPIDCKAQSNPADYYPPFPLNPNNYFPIYYYYKPYYSSFKTGIDPYENRLLFGNIMGTKRPLWTLFGQPIVNLFSSWPIFTLNSFDTCQDVYSGEYGTCMGKMSCRRMGGSSGSICGFGTFCCISPLLSQCGAQITLNNTYWKAPNDISGIRNCGTTINLGTTRLRQLDQESNICQVRLDFISFEVSRPVGKSTCNADQFQVIGVSNTVPPICGENSGQHMYLHVQPGSTEIKLNFDFSSGNSRRDWRIKVSLLPCGASYLAPSGCLQYYPVPSGSVNSFYSENVLMSDTPSASSTSNPTSSTESTTLSTATSTDPTSSSTSDPTTSTDPATSSTSDSTTSTEITTLSTATSTDPTTSSTSDPTTSTDPPTSSTSDSTTSTEITTLSTATSTDPTTSSTSDPTTSTETSTSISTSTATTSPATTLTSTTAPDPTTSTVLTTTARPTGKPTSGRPTPSIPTRKMSSLAFTTEAPAMSVTVNQNLFSRISREGDFKYKNLRLGDSDVKICQRRN